MPKSSPTDHFRGFSKLNHAERLHRLQAAGYLTADEIAQLQHAQQPPLTLAEQFIENALGYFPLPLGVAVNFHIDGRDRIIPMAVEETSIIAAASKTARWIKESGKLTTQQLSNQAIGQIQFPVVRDFTRFQNLIEHHRQTIIDELNHGIAAGLVKRGGGVKQLQIRQLSRPDQQWMGIIHVLVDTCDAMGANIITQICEHVKTHLEAITQETGGLAILSNLTDQKLTQAQAVIYNIDPKLGHAIAEASLFAELDPYRAATHNKGILNGIDPLLIATGNDWRAVEAGMHAYAARSGRYRALSSWRMQGKDLIGTLIAPISVGIVGGMTRLHPLAQLALKMLQVNSASELARIVAAVGLVQNLGALRALATEGIVQGHMKLHINNLLLAAGASETEQARLRAPLQALLANQKRITLQDVKAALATLRAQ